MMPQRISPQFLLNVYQLIAWENKSADGVTKLKRRAFIKCSVVLVESLVVWYWILVFFVLKLGYLHIWPWQHSL